MQPSSPFRRQWTIPALAIGGLVVIILLSNRPIETLDGMPIVSDDESFAVTLRDAATNNTPVFEAFDQGEDISEADKAKARKGGRMIDAATNLHPDRAGLYLDSGRAYLIAGDIGTADLRLMQCLSNAALKGSDLPKEGLADAEYLLSLVRAQQGEWKASLLMVTSADKIRPNVATYLTAKASAELQLRQMDQAKADLTKALLIDSTYKRALQLKRLMEIDMQAQ